MPAGELARPSGLPEDQDRRLVEVHITTLTLFVPDAPPRRVLSRGRGRLLVAVTEKRTRAEMDAYVAALEKVVA